MTEESIAGTLHELAEKWRFEYEPKAGSGGYHHAARAYERCADELEEALEASA